MGGEGRFESVVAKIDSDFQWVLKYSGVIVLTLIVFYVVLGFNLEALGLPTKLGPFSLLPSDNRLRTVGIAASGILTFTLIYVYRNIGEIQQEQADQLEGQKDLQKDVNKLQEQQTKILDKQEAWMRAEHTPILSIESWSADAGEASVYISNVGNGVAKALTVLFRIGPTETGWSFDEEEIEFRAPLYEEHNTRAMQPKTEPVKFSGNPQSSQVFEEENEFSSYAGRLEGEEITYLVSVAFEDISGEVDEKDIWVAKSEITEPEMTIEGLILNTTEEVSPSGSVAPDNLGSRFRL